MNDKYKLLADIYEKAAAAAAHEAFKVATIKYIRAVQVGNNTSDDIKEMDDKSC